MSKWITINSHEDLKKVPQVFTTEPDPGASEKYEFVNTYDIITGAERLGWKVVSASGVGNGKYGYHAIKMEHPDYVTEKGDKIQLIINNSHDRSRRFSIEIGVFRLVCSNGLVIAIIEFASLKKKHIGFESIELLEELLATMESIGMVAPKIREMSERELTLDERKEIALKAIMCRIEDEEQAETVDLDALLHPKRTEDIGNDLWRTFNTVQEKVIHGEYKYMAENKKGKMVERKARQISGFKTDLELNRKLFEIANSYTLN